MYARARDYILIRNYYCGRGRCGNHRRALRRRFRRDYYTVVVVVVVAADVPLYERVRCRRDVSYSLVNIAQSPLFSRPRLSPRERRRRREIVICDSIACKNCMQLRTLLVEKGSIERIAITSMVRFVFPFLYEIDVYVANFL